MVVEIKMIDNILTIEFKGWESYNRIIINIDNCFKNKMYVTSILLVTHELNPCKRTNGICILKIKFLPFFELSLFPLISPRKYCSILFKKKNEKKNFNK